MTGETTHEGGCFCGAIRYSIKGPIPPGAHCHCSMCRKSSGGTLVTWVMVPMERFTVTRGEPAIYKSSEEAERSFCSNCGTQLIFRSKSEPLSVDITVSSLDEPQNHPPDRHIWSRSRLPWVRMDDGLPEYSRFTPPERRSRPD